MLKNILIGLVVLVVLAPIVAFGSILTGDSLALKLSMLVYLVENITTWDFYTLGDAIGLLTWLAILGGVAFALSFLLEFKDADGKTVPLLEKYNLKDNLLKPLGNVALIILFVGFIGSAFDKLIPSKDTAWVMSAAYVSGSAIDNCSDKDTVCADLLKKINSKGSELLDLGSDAVKKATEAATSAAENLKAPDVEAATEKATEAVTKVVDAAVDAASKAEVNVDLDKVGNTIDKATELAKVIKE